VVAGAAGVREIEALDEGAREPRGGGPDPDLLFTVNRH
jgi:hypothetical protein